MTDHAMQSLRRREPILWINPGLRPAAAALADLPLRPQDVQEAADRLARFAPLLAELFPETRAAGGIIESALVPAPALQAALGAQLGADVPGRVWVKCDHALPVAGSVKARGGIYEVLCLAERLAVEGGVLRAGGALLRLAQADARALFARWTVAVASTGNLGLSVGVAARALGFHARVHMSVQARPWKVERLRGRGVEVVQHAGDVNEAGRAARERAAAEPRTYFVDDERSPLLFLGYSVAGLRLREQMQAAGAIVDARRPLLAWLPCGLGGAPVGITFGLKAAFGDAAHCFTVEPVDAPCLLLGMLTGFPEGGSVYDMGLTNRTEADGLACARPSRFVGPFAQALLTGCCTVEDDDLFRWLHLLAQAEGIEVEPSAAAGVGGLAHAVGVRGRAALSAAVPEGVLRQAHHVIWTTGGLLAPRGEIDAFLERGRRACAAERRANNSGG